MTNVYTYSLKKSQSGGFHIRLGGGFDLSSHNLTDFERPPGTRFWRIIFSNPAEKGQFASKISFLLCNPFENTLNSPDLQISRCFLFLMVCFISNLPTVSVSNHGTMVSCRDGQVQNCTVKPANLRTHCDWLLCAPIRIHSDFCGLDAQRTYHNLNNKSNQGR